MKSMKFAALIVLAGAGLAFVSTAHGAPLLIGGAMFTPAEPDPFLGTVVGFTVQPFATVPGPGQFSGTLTTTVILDDPSNPYANIGNPNPALHGLTFVYQLHNNAVSINPLSRITNVDFTPFLTDVSYQPGAGLLPPTSTDRTSSPAIIGWSFTGAPLGLGKITSGTTTTPLVIQSNAPGFIDVLANIIDGSVVQTRTYGPIPDAIFSPEPSALSLLLIGTFGLVRRRR
jgi:hypothetical protein